MTDKSVWRRAKLPRVNIVYVFSLFTKPLGRRRIERWMILLDSGVFLHGAVGLVYALVLDHEVKY